MFIGNSAEPMVFLRQGDGTSHLNNTSKGGNGKMLSFQQLSPDIRRDALTAVKALKREISGVDVIINNKTGEHYILEVNSTPALATGFATNEKIQAFSKFIENLTEEMEE